MSHLPRKILLATDGSEDARLAARAAASLADRPGRSYTSCTPGRACPIQSSTPTTMRKGPRILKEQIEVRLRLRGRGERGPPRDGSPVDVILDLAEEIGVELIVVGGRGHGTLGRLILGSVSEGVVHHATCPVLVLRGGESAWPPERVVIGDDGSEAAKRAGELASSIGALFGARGVLLRAYPELPEADRVGRALDPRAVDDALRRAEREPPRARRAAGWLGRDASQDGDGRRATRPWRSSRRPGKEWGRNPPSPWVAGAWGWPGA